MAYSIYNGIGDGVTSIYPINFTLGFLKRDDVSVRVGSEVDGLGAPVYRSITWINDGLIKIEGGAPGFGIPFVIARTVDKTKLAHDYSTGEPIVEDNLDESNKQTLMAVQEILDGRLAPIQVDLDMSGNRIINLGDGVSSTDAVNKGQLDVVEALASTGADVATAQAAIATSQATIATTQAGIATAAVGNLSGTSSTSNTLGTGSKSFTTQANKYFTAGTPVTISSAANPTVNWMTGIVSSYSGTSLVVAISAFNGGGSFTDWQIKVSGVIGPTGPTGPTGAGTGDMLKSDNLSGLANYSTARGNLGLGSLATLNAPASNSITGAMLATTSMTSAELAAALSTKTGTGNAVFSASPALTGIPTAPTASPGTNTDQIATMAALYAAAGAASTIAFVTFDGVSGVSVLAQSANILSVVRNSTGRYTITFDPNLPDANYAVSTSFAHQGTSGTNQVAVVSASASTLVLQAGVTNIGGSNVTDNSRISVTIQR